MADDALRSLVCLVEGDESLRFIVEPTGSMNIIELKILIKEAGKKSVLSDVDANDLTLWKVRMTMASDSTTKSPAG
jgi:Crinkler effector protein N-terminal domain